jgi:hypothetical protein
VRILAGLLIAGLYPAALCAQAPARDTLAPTGTAVIRGRVMAAGADRPLSRVEVRATCPPLKVNKAVLTGADGRYEIADLPAGRYTVGFSRTNYVRASFGQRRPLGQGAPIDVANGQVVTRIDAALQLAGVVSGRVLDEFGDPMTAVQVMPMRYSSISGERRLQPTGMSSVTNDIGEYRIYNLAPGQYFIAAFSRGNLSGSDTDRAYLPTYYPGTGSVMDAQRLTVAAGQAIDGINLSLLPVTAARITGVALDSRGRPMAGGNVNLSQRIGAGTYGTSYGQVRPDGTFTIGGVAPGEYAITISLTGAPDEIAAADVTVSGTDITGLQIAAVKQSLLRGRVVFEAGDVKPPLADALFLTVRHASLLSATSESDVPKRDGTFALKTSGGHVMISAGLSGSSDWRMNRVLTPDGSDVTDTGFDVPVGNDIDGLVVEMTTRVPDVSGTVLDAAGTAVRDCVVVLFAQDPLRWSARSRYFGIARPDADNVFHARVPAGEYYAAAFELDDPAISLNDPEILRQLRDQSTRVSIGDGEKKTIALTLGQAPVF